MHMGQKKKRKKYKEKHVFGFVYTTHVLRPLHPNFISGFATHFHFHFPAFSHCLRSSVTQSSCTPKTREKNIRWNQASSCTFHCWPNQRDKQSEKFSNNLTTMRQCEIQDLTVAHQICGDRYVYSYIYRKDLTVC